MPTLIFGGVELNNLLISKKSPRSHQTEAINSAQKYFIEENQEKGKLIMACGTGKTFTSLKIAEKLLPQINSKSTKTLFLVPSISLLSQSLQEWSEQADLDFIPICVCSDTSVGSKNKTDEEDSLQFNRLDLGFPATTNTKKLQEKLNQHSQENIVIFSTYQSIDIIEKLDINFDLVVCDEAHRTTGAKNSTDMDSNFTKVHSSIKASKAIFMTATPKVYGTQSQSKAKDNDYILYSMDNEELYGKEFYTLGFGKAVEKQLLSDYKVLILTVNESDINEELKNQIQQKEIQIDTSKNKSALYNANVDTAGKLIGCINALSKKILSADNIIKEDAHPMKTALAFCSQIKTSQNVKELFNECSQTYYNGLEDNHNLVQVSAKHIDGGMNSTKRNQLLDWLKNPEDNQCRILTNARCLSEGIDVPALDAIIFLNPRKSQIDIVQSIGRVMRRADNKEYGYVILPLIIPSSANANEYLNNDKNFEAIWEILNALRSHDDRFQATIEAIKLNKNKPTAGGSIQIASIDSSLKKEKVEKTEEIEATESTQNLQANTEVISTKIGQLNLDLENVRNILYAKIVEKCGDKTYWENWAKDIAKTAETYVARISNLIDENQPVKTEFDNFISQLKNNLNPQVEKTEAIEMLAQHLISKPVFDALFEEKFIKNNPVSQYLENITNLLQEHNLHKENANLASFYDSVKKRISGVDEIEGKQKIIIELYDKFFKNALPKQAEKLGIVYTPVEVIDFIINSTSAILQKEFSRELTDENIHILDPFTGTGTFITRLLQSKHIKPEDLPRKYEKEIHCNEILLLAYYIACVNIELTYMEVATSNTKEQNSLSTTEGVDCEAGRGSGKKESINNNYKIFNGACWTDTFNIDEVDAEKRASNLFDGTDNRFNLAKNSKRIQKQQQTPLTIIMGNPPYSVGQKSSNSNNKNNVYPKLHQKIAETYAKESASNNLNNLYDSYIKAFRYASDRIKSNGIIAFITNNGFLDSSSADGLRKCFNEEFTSIYIFNLKGKTKMRGGDAFEGENIFGIQTGVSINILVKNSNSAEHNIYYYDISQQTTNHKKLEKLNLLKDYKDILNENIKFENIIPDDYNDWLNKRDNYFKQETFYPLEKENSKETKADKEYKGEKESINIFNLNSNGLKTGRNNWCFNFSKETLTTKIKESIDFYNIYADKFKNKEITELPKSAYDNTKFSWNRECQNDAIKGKNYTFNENDITIAMYKPFIKQVAYYNKELRDRAYQLPKIFPMGSPAPLKQRIISVAGKDNKGEFHCLMVNNLIEHSTLHVNKIFPLYIYEDNQVKSGISEKFKDLVSKKYNFEFSNEDIFHYIYGILHSPIYREKAKNDLKKELPSIPLVASIETFKNFVKAGYELAELHLNYENYKEQAIQELDIKIAGEESQNYKINKSGINFAKIDKNKDKSIINYNENITISNIPLSVYSYIINGKSAIDWVVSKYAYTIDTGKGLGKSNSGIINDPNLWLKENNNPKYIVDLICSLAYVSHKTLKIMDSLKEISIDTK
ncbi:MAG: DEAD/DEAH box helicase family protein [Alphaproteobacteria bacterium]|jgi:predicted helicase|nr:DEAD/DEAH box helicase family protein [Alphaproteobacteria bacterium]